MSMFSTRTCQDVDARNMSASRGQLMSMCYRPPATAVSYLAFKMVSVVA
jgi:hypothetical protein